MAKEKIERLCAKGKIAIDLRGSQYLQALEGEDENTTWPKVRGRLGTGAAPGVGSEAAGSEESCERQQGTTHGRSG